MAGSPLPPVVRALLVGVGLAFHLTDIAQLRVPPHSPGSRDRASSTVRARLGREGLPLRSALRSLLLRCLPPSIKSVPWDSRSLIETSAITPSPLLLRLGGALSLLRVD